MKGKTLHLMLIADGSRRWARREGMSVAYGYRETARNIARVIDHCTDSRAVHEFTVPVCSVRNMARPDDEVEAFLEGFSHIPDDCENPVRVSIEGNLSLLPSPFLLRYTELPEQHRAGSHVRLLLCWSLVDEVSRIAASITADAAQICPEAFISRSDIKSPVDLIFRSGDAPRLSDLIPFASPYANLHFSRQLFPDVLPTEVDAAIDACLSGRAREGV